MIKQCNALFIGIILLLLPTISIAQLSGKYSIGGEFADYETITEAVNALTSNVGICGRVIFEIQEGVYEEKIEILRNINGSSSANTITFRGVGKYRVVIKDVTPLELFQTQFIKIENLTLESTEDGTALSQIKYCRITNCIIRAKKDIDPQYFDAFTSTRGSQDTLEFCRITGGYRGVILNQCSHYVVRNNTMVRSLANALSEEKGFYNIITQNCMDSLRSEAVGSIASMGGGKGTKFCKNKLFYTENTGRGIAIGSMNTKDTTHDNAVEISNNFIGGTSKGKTEGICILNRSRYVDILNNTVIITGSNSASTCLYSDNGKHVKLLNNNFYLVANQGYALRVTDPSSIDSTDYNNLYVNSSKLAYFSKPHYSIADLQLQGKSTGHSQHSISIEPQITNYKDYLYETSAFDNKGYKWVAVREDIANNKRPSKPDTDLDIGCVSFYRHSTDAGVNGQINHPSCGDTIISFNGVLSNFGRSKLTSCTLNWATSINGKSYITQPSIKFTGTLDPGTNKSLSLGSIKNSAWQSIKLKVWTSDPNSTTDKNPNNDTNIVIKHSPLNGNYTVGKKGDFATIMDAVASLSTNGVCSSVTFRLLDSIYEEHVRIPKISGASKTKRIRIVGRGSKRTTIRYYAGGTRRISTILLESADYITIDSVNIVAENPDVGSCYWLSGRSDYNILSNSVLICDRQTTDRDVNPYVISGNSISKTGGTGGVYNQVLDCELIGGYIGYYATGQKTSYLKGNHIIGCKFRNQYHYAIRSVYISHRKIVGNDIDSIRGSSGSGIYVPDGKSDSIASNRVISSARYAIQLENQNYLSSRLDSSYIVNNVFIGGTENTIETLNLERVMFYNNTIHGSNTITLKVNYSKQCEWFNNSFSNSNGGYAFFLRYHVWSRDSNKNNFNNYYSPKASSPVYCSKAYSSLSAWKTATPQFNKFSIEEDPTFTSPINFRSNSHHLNNSGKKSPRFQIDKANMPRPSLGDTLPDIGAYEFYLDSNRIEIVSIQPTNFTLGDNDIILTIQNNGQKPILKDTAFVSYSIDGSVVNDTIVITNLNQNSIINFTFSTPYNVSATKVKSTVDFCVSVDSITSGDPAMLATLCIDPCFPKFGKYTIKPSGSGDFKTFQEAVDHLATCGIAGPVIIEVAKGVYNERIVIPEIPGTTDRNTISFINKGKKADVHIKYLSTEAATAATIALLGADHIHISNMTIEALGKKFGVAVQLRSASDYNTFSSCIMKTDPKAKESHTYGINFTDTVTQFKFPGNSGNYNLFENNRIIGGKIGLSITGGPSTSSVFGNSFFNNKFIGQYNFGIVTDRSKHMKIVGNVIDSLRNPKTNYGILLDKASGDSIAGNKVLNAHKALHYVGFGILTDTSYIINNMLISKSRGAYFFVCHNSFFIGNSIFITDTAYLEAVNFLYCYYLTARNNSIHRIDGGTVLKLNNGVNSDFDYNNWYSAGASNPIDFEGVKYASLSAYRSATGLGTNSIEIEPRYASSKDLRTHSPLLDNQGTNIPRFATDIDHKKRPSSPDVDFDIGVNDYSLRNIDADIIGVSTSHKSSDKYNVLAKIENAGSIHWRYQDSVHIQYSIDGQPPVRQAFLTKGMNPGSAEFFKFTVPFSLAKRSQVQICVSFYKLFKNKDRDNLSDSFCITPCLNGIHPLSIDSSGYGDFKTIGEANAYLNCLESIHNPITFRLKGHFKEAVEFTPIQGASATNFIRFVGEGLRKTSITYEGDGTQPVIHLNGADYFIFDSLSIISTAPYGGRAVQLDYNADKNTITNCRITASQLCYSNRNFAILGGSFDGSTQKFNFKKSTNGLTLINNQIEGGKYGLALLGKNRENPVNDHIIQNNTFKHSYSSGVYLHFVKNTRIEHNDFDSLKTDSGSNIHLTLCYKSTILSNSIKTGKKGIFLVRENKKSTDTSYVVNNMISKLSGVEHSGIHTFKSSRIHVIHNSIWASSTTVDTLQAAALFVESDTLEIQNNNFVNSEGGLAFSQQKCALIAGAVDYNNYFAPSSSSLAYWDTKCTDLAALKSKSLGYNATSISTDPGYISQENLHSFSPFINNKGTNKYTWPEDMDKEKRPTAPDKTVDIGADDFSIPSFDLDVNFIISPEKGTLGKNGISASFQNRGLKNLSGEQALVSYSINGASPEYDTIQLKFLPVGADTIYQFNSPWVNSTSGQFEVCISVDSIFSQSSDIADKKCQTGCTGIKDTLVVDATGKGDYLTIGEAISAISCRILGPTVIYVKNGIYKEYVVLADLEGTSRANTLEIKGESRHGVIWKNNHGFSTLLLSNVHHTSISNLTMESPLSLDNGGSLIHLMNTCRDIKITNCNFIGSDTSSNSNTALIAASSSATKIKATGSTVENIDISNCVFSGGYYGLCFNGKKQQTPSDSLTINSNRFNSQFKAAIYLTQRKNSIITSNSIDSLRGTGSAGIYSRSNHISRISTNSITNHNGFGMYLQCDNVTNLSLDSTWVYNNTVNLTNTNNTKYAAFYGEDIRRTMVYHNTFVTYSAQKRRASSVVLLSEKFSHSQLKNNIIAALNGGQLASFEIRKLHEDAIDYNNYYSTSSFKVYLEKNYSTFAGWQAGNRTINKHSMSVNPYFNSSTDLHAGARMLISAGKPLGIKVDMDGQKRNTKRPDIGADEIWKDLSISSTHLIKNQCRANSETDSFKVRIHNDGESAFTPGDTLYMSYKDGSLPPQLDTFIISNHTKIPVGESIIYSYKTPIASGVKGIHNVFFQGEYFDDADLANNTSSSSFFTNSKPIASFSVDEVCTYETSMFKNTSTIQKGNISSYEWHLGNGQTKTSSDFGYKYGISDTFMVRLRIESDSGCVDSFHTLAIIHPVPKANYSSTDICLGDKAKFTNSSSIAHGKISYDWDFDFRANVSSLEHPKFTYLKSGSFDTELLVTSDKGCKDTAYQSLTVNPSPVASFDATEVCEGNKTLFTNKSTIGSGRFTSKWDLGNGQSDTAKSLGYSYSSPSIYSVKLLESTSLGCKDSITKQVAVHPNPTSSFQADNICVSDTLKPFNNSTLATNQTWHFGDSRISNNVSPLHNYKTLGSYDISLVVESSKKCRDSSSRHITVSNSSHSGFTVKHDCVYNILNFINTTSKNCGAIKDYSWHFGDGKVENYTTRKNPSHIYKKAGIYKAKLVITRNDNSKDSTEKSITVYDQPNVKYSHSLSCEDNNVSFTNLSNAATSSIITSFAWTFGNGSFSTDENPSTTYAKSGTYYSKLIITDNRNCKDTLQKTITVYPKPSADFSLKNACAYDPIILTNSSSIASGSLTDYDWDFGNSTFGTAKNENVLYNTSGTFTVKLSVLSDKGCLDSVAKKAIAFDVPRAHFATKNVCLTDSISLANRSTDASTYQWNFGDKSGVSASTNPSYLYSTSGLYTITLIASNSTNCTDTFSKEKTIYNLPKVSFTASDVCIGNEALFSNTTSGINSYHWLFGDGISSTLPSPKHTYKTLGSYQIKLAATSINNCTDTAYGVITQHPYPAPSFQALDICEHDSVSMLNHSKGASSYLWDYGDGSIPSASKTHKYASSGTFKIILSATSSAGCTAKDSINIVIWPKPKASFSTSIHCFGDSTVFTNSSKLLGQTIRYQWQFGNTSDTSKRINPKYLFTNTNTPTVKLIARSQQGCFDTLIQTVKLNPLPAMAFSASNSCVGTKVNFTNSTKRAVLYDWDFDDGDTSSRISPIHTFLNSGTYQVNLKAKSSDGCENDSNLSLIIYPNPTIAFSVNDTCIGDSTRMFNRTSGAVSYEWRYGDGSGSLLKSPSHMYSVVDSYSVTLIATSSTNCVDSLTLPAKVFGLPVVSISCDTVCQGQTTTYSNSTTGASSYIWRFGDGTAKGTKRSANHYFSKAGKYKTTLRATSALGCKNIDTCQVVVYEQPKAKFNADTVCALDSTHFTIKSVVSTSVLPTWNFGGGVFSTDAAPAFAFPSGGTYNVKLLLSTSNGCIDSVTHSVEVMHKPIALMSANDTCLTDEVSFTDNGSSVQSGSIGKRQWIFGDGSNFQGSSASHFYTIDSTYDVKYIVSTDIGCSDTASQSVTIHPLPVPDFAIKDTCEKSHLNIINKSFIRTGAISTFLWDFGDAITSSLSVPVHKIDTFGSYNIALELTSDKGCKSSQKQKVTIHPLPKTNYSSEDLCSRDSFLLKNKSSIAQGNLTYLWDFGDGNSSSDKHPSHIYNLPGIYESSLLAISDQNCSSTHQLSLKTHLKPDASLLLENICLGDTIHLPSSVLDSIHTKWTYSLDFGNGSIFQTIPNGYLYSEKGNYSIYFKIESDNNCKDSSTTDLKVYEVPTIDNFSYVRMGNQTLEFALQDTVGLQVEWDFGDGSNDKSTNPTHTYTSPGEYTVSCIVTNAKGCSDSHTIALDVYPTGISPITTNHLKFNAYPNPFSKDFTLNYRLDNATHVHLQVFNIQGKMIQNIVNTDQEAGDYILQINQLDLPNSGNLIIRLITTEQIAYIKMIRLD